MRSAWNVRRSGGRVVLPDDHEYAEVRGNLGMLCIHQRGPSPLTVCGRPLYEVLPADWVLDPDDKVHGDCLRKVLDLPVPKPQPGGVGRCPMCNRDAPVVDGRIGRHEREPGEACVGVNLKPRRGRR